MASASRQTPSVTICPYHSGKKHTQCFVIQTKWQKVLQVLLAKITTYTLWKKQKKDINFTRTTASQTYRKKNQRKRETETETDREGERQIETGSAREKQADRQDIL